MSFSAYELQAGADPYYRDGDGYTTLQRAIKEGASLEMIDQIIQEGGKVNMRVSHKPTWVPRPPMNYKGPTNRIHGKSKTRTLISKKGDTSLMLEIRNRCRFEIIDRLIQAGANVNMEDNNGHTSLYLAVDVVRNRGGFHLCSLKVIDLLIKATIGADVNAENSEAIKVLEKTSQTLEGPTHPVVPPMPVN